MRRLLLRLLPGFLVVALFASFFATSAFASTPPPHPNSVSGTLNWMECYPDGNNGLINALGNYIYYSGTGNASGCPSSTDLYSFQSFEFPQYGDEGTLGSWTDTAISTNAKVLNCNIYAQFPYGNYSSDTKVRYDFWYGSHWLSWTAINQYSIAAGLQPIATNLSVNGSGANVRVTVRDNGGSGWLALAAMKFSCTYSNL